MQRKYQIYFVLMKESIEPSNVFDGTIGCNILSFQDLTCSIHQDPKERVELSTFVLEYGI